VKLEGADRPGRKAQNLLEDGKVTLKVCILQCSVVSGQTPPASGA